MHNNETSTYHHGDLKACLIGLARSRVLTHGPEAVSLRDLSREAGVSHAAAYRHFPTKEALLNMVATQGFEELTRACQDACGRSAAAPLSQLLACGLAYVAFGRRNARLLGLMFGEAGQWLETKGAETPRSQAAAELFTVLLVVVQSGQARGDIVAHEPRTVAWTCWAIVHGCASLAPAETSGLDPAQRLAIEERVLWSLQTIVKGLHNGTSAPHTQLPC